MNMLNGIEILNKVELMKTVNNIVAHTFCFIIGIITALALLLAIVMFISNNVDMGAIMVVVGLVFVIIYLISYLIDSGLSKQVPTGEYEYQVTISNDVSMVEFNEKYEVIKVEGKIWTIREKEK